jgi:hypothetical protein
MIYNEIFLAAKLTHAVPNKNTFAEKTVLVIEGKYPDLHFYYFIIGDEYIYSLEKVLFNYKKLILKNTLFNKSNLKL